MSLLSTGAAFPVIVLQMYVPMQLNIELHMYVLILSMTITHVHTEPFIAIGLYTVYILSQLLYNTAPHAHSHINSAIIKSN